MLAEGRNYMLRSGAVGNTSQVMEEARQEGQPETDDDGEWAADGLAPFLPDNLHELLYHVNIVYSISGVNSVFLKWKLRNEAPRNLTPLGT